MTQMMSQREVADELDVTEASVSRTLTQADKRLKKSYVDWRATKMFADKSQSNIIDEVKGFLDRLVAIIEVDTEDTFCYFTLIVNWLKQNSDESDFEIDYEALQKNNWGTVDSVVDAITDNITSRQMNIVTDVLERHVRGLDEDYTYTKRQRETFARAVTQALYKYLESMQESVVDFMHQTIDGLAVRNNEKLNQNKVDDYNGVIELLEK